MGLTHKNFDNVTVAQDEQGACNSGVSTEHNSGVHAAHCRHTELEQLLLAVAEMNRSIAATTVSPRDSDGALADEIGALRAWGVREDVAPPGFYHLSQTQAAQDIASRIDYARKHMPCLTALAAACRESRGDAFRGVRIAADLILEVKTVVLLTTLADLGAEIGISCCADSVDDEVVNALRAHGIKVLAGSDYSPAEDLESALSLLDGMAASVLLDGSPFFILDDGANLTRLLYTQRPELVPLVTGISEETTCGVDALLAMEAEGVLLTPAVAVNDAPIKTLFDNVHGTSETVIATTLRLTGESASGKTTVVAGYGAVGAGLAKRLAALGSRVIVCEISPVSALRAVHDGYQVMPLGDASAQADWIFSATGARHTVTADAIRRMKDGAVVVSAGGSFEEIDTRGASDTITILTDGLGVNYTGGPGNPIEIMDLSFAGQFSSLLYLLDHAGELPPGVLRLPHWISEQIAAIKLNSMKIAIDEAPESSSWRFMRFGAES